MNITTIFKKMINEAAEVERIKASVGDKVPASVMDTLARNAKQTQRGSFFDNEAMAIIRSISNGNKDPYLLQNPNAVHSILKKLKRGDSSFKADEVLNGGSGKSYWKELYQKSNAEKPNQTQVEKDYNATGLKTAIVKSVDDKWFAIFPKNFYDTKNAEKELKSVDLEKSHEDIRRISTEIAAKDSGKDKGAGQTWDRGDAAKDPRVNHWCVSASRSDYYKSYTNNRIYKFIIFVKKNKDGSPNWDNRYLWYYDGVGMDEEFADKWDRHVSMRVLSSAARKLTESVITSIRQPLKKREEFKSNITKAALKKAEADKSKTIRTEYDVEIDDELENMLTGSVRRKDLSKAEEKSIILKSMPWLDEASKLKAPELGGFFRNKAVDSAYTLYSSNSPVLMFTNDNYESGVLIILNSKAGFSMFLIFKGTANLGKTLFWNFRGDFDLMAKHVDSALYKTNCRTYKQLLDALLSITGNGKVGASQKTIERTMVGDKREPLAPIHVIKNNTPTERTVMTNLSKVGQEIFDKAYSQVIPLSNDMRIKLGGDSKSTYNKLYYNSEVKTIFGISYSWDEGYRVSYKDPDEIGWKKLALINGEEGSGIEEAKKAVKNFIRKKKANLAKENNNAERR